MKIHMLLITCLLLGGITLTSCTSQQAAPESPSVDISNIHQPEGDSSTPVPTVSPFFEGPDAIYSFIPPSGWEHNSKQDKFLQVDTFTAPDGTASIEAMIYDDGQPFDGAKIREFAIYLLNTYYSISGQAGDIQITSEQMVESGENRIEWTSRNGGYSGASLYQIHGADQARFILFTTRWMNGIDQEISSAIEDAVKTFQLRRD